MLCPGHDPQSQPPLSNKAVEMANMDCQLGKISNPLGNKRLGVPRSPFLD